MERWKHGRRHMGWKVEVKRIFNDLGKNIKEEIEMKFTPRTEQEITDGKLWKKGEYPFEIVDAYDKESKSSGRPMIELKLRLTDSKAARIITDYLLDETPEKLRHAASACGLLEVYETGSVLAEDFRGKSGRVSLGIKKDPKRQYPDKNVVLDYLCPESVKKVASSENGFGLKF
jgi:hypothetical protein